MKRRIAILLMATASFTAYADDQTPEGLWKTIDDSTGRAKAMVQISEKNGVWSGKVVRLFRTENEVQNPKCDQCTDERKGQPVIGMTILKNLQKDGNEYTGGEILDPANGKTYKAKAKLEESGHKLSVRGYLGVAAFGRTQTWLRED